MYLGSYQLVSELALPFEVPTLGVVAYGVVAWTQKKKGANRDQHSRDQRARSGGLWSGGLDPKRGANRDQHSRDQRGRWFFKGWGIVMIPHRPKLALPFEVPTLGVVAYGVVAWTQKKKGANRDQHSRDQRARSGGLWSGGLDPKRGANRDQHSRDQRGRWFFKGWGIVMIPHRPKLALPFEVPTLGVVAYGVVAWTQKKKGANRDQHSRDQRARSGGLWSGGLDPKRGANRDQHSRDQRGRWFFKGWGIVMIPHRPSSYQDGNKLSISSHSIPATSFPDHYFKFAGARTDVKTEILTGVGEQMVTGDATRKRHCKFMIGILLAMLEGR
ncbi:hypothetical protein Tco_0934785 [Tanacetum coccineum]